MTPEDFRKDYLLAITLACDLGNRDGVKRSVAAAEQAFAQARREENEACARIADYHADMSHKDAIDIAKMQPHRIARKEAFEEASLLASAIAAAIRARVK